MNRTQTLVAGFPALVWIAVLASFVLAADVYADALGIAGRAAGGAFLLAIAALVALLVLGVARSWRWTFWLVLVALLAAIVRLPAALLQLSGLLPASARYLVSRGLRGLAQFAIGLAMLAGYRRGGIWGAF